VLNSKAVLGFG